MKWLELNQYARVRLYRKILSFCQLVIRPPQWNGLYEIDKERMVCVNVSLNRS